MESEVEERIEEEVELQGDEAALNSEEWKEAYGTPMPEEQFNQHTFLAKSLEREEPEKVTFMSLSELGTPLFNLRFLLDIEDISRHYIDPYAIEFGQGINKIADYFRQKIKNISDSGMSNQGFVQNLNVTRKMDVNRKKSSGNIDNLKGGKKK